MAGFYTLMTILIAMIAVIAIAAMFAVTLISFFTGKKCRACDGKLDRNGKCKSCGVRNT
jgi:hypothetical protein